MLQVVSSYILHLQFETFLRKLPITPCAHVYMASPVFTACRLLNMLCGSHLLVFTLSCLLPDLYLNIAFRGGTESLTTTKLFNLDFVPLFE